MSNYRSVGAAPFPAHTGQCVNMMPFVMGDASSLPECLRAYQPMLDACAVPASELGKVGYLTVDERYVVGGASYRRAGLHTEGWGPLSERMGWGGGGWGGGARPSPAPRPRPAPKPAQTPDTHEDDFVRLHASWGGWGGVAGGLYVANTVEHSCALYDATVTDTVFGGAVAPEQVAGLRPHLMPARQLYWMHDRVPHASLPVPAGLRQFFRLVTSEVSLWFADHSTPNLLGVQPAARIVEGNKFAMAPA